MRMKRRPGGKAALLGLLLAATFGAGPAAGAGDGSGLWSGSDVINEGTRFEVRRIDPDTRLRPAGPLDPLDRPRSGLSVPGLDCVPFHERVERDARRAFPHRCDPAADIDVGLPAFTAR